MLEDILEYLAFLGGALVFLLAVICLFYVTIDSQTCAATSDAMGLKHSWGFWQGCMVTVGDQTVPLDVYLKRTVPFNVELH